ncbi:MAG: class I adenylate-forming enzyme family protein [Acidimicrobiia bacterium]
MVTTARQGEDHASTVWERVAASAEQFPDHDALVAADDAGAVQRITYRALIERATNLSGGLAETGVRRGDRLVLWVTNTPEWVIVALAAMRIGAIVVPANTFFKPPEIEYVLRQSGARHVVMLDEFRAVRMPDMLATICPEFGAANEPGFLCSERLPDLRNAVVFNRNGGKHPGAFDLDALETAGGARDARSLAERLAGMVEPRDLAMVKYTSGSTGFPKGVMLEHAGIVKCALEHSRRIGVDGSDVWFSMMPFFHAGGSIWGLMTMLVHGGTLVFTEAFNPRVGAQLIDTERATVQFGVLPNELLDAAVEDGRDLSSLRIGPRVASETAQKLFSNVTFTIIPFGLTEAYGPAAVNSPDDPPGIVRTRMLDGNELRVVDPETGREVGPGEVGEAWIRGNVMRGYWNKAEETARALDDDGWLHSEDLVTVDADGHVRFVGRLKLMLKVGGENVSLEEVEGVVTQHPAVAACGAVGVPDARLVEVVRAYVELEPRAHVDAEELRAWLGERLARFKVPRDIVFLPELPQLANGKIDRVELDRLAREGQEEEVGA